MNMPPTLPPERMPDLPRHPHIEDLLPFFVAGTLSAAESEYVRQHLPTCPQCRQALTEWFEIAHAVQAEAEAWGVPLPPLSEHVRNTIGRAAQPPRRWQPQPPAVDGRRTATPITPAPRPQPRVVSGETVPTQPVSKRPPELRPSGSDLRSVPILRPRPARRPPLTMVATFVTVFFVASMVFLTRRGDPGSSVTAVPSTTVQSVTATPLAVALNTTFTPSPTLSIPTLVVTAPVPTAALLTEGPAFKSTTATSMIGIGGGGGDATPRGGIQPIDPTPMPILPLPTDQIPPGVCAASNATGLDVPIYGQPDDNGTIIANLPPSQRVIVFVQSGNGWYQVSTIGGMVVGWMRGEMLAFTGPCGDIPLPTPTPLATSPSSVCYLIPNAPTVTYLYYGPDESFGIASPTLAATEYIALTRTDSGWWEVNYSLHDGLHFGWVKGTEVSTSGSCENVEVVPASRYPTPFPAPAP
jgi:anti-sigma factor RsiW